MTAISLVFTTERLILQPLQRMDRAALVTAAGNPSVSNTMITVPHPMTLAVAQQWIERDEAAISSGTAIPLTIRRLSHPALLGMVTLRQIDPVHARAELSFWLAAEGRGNGYATEACAAVLRHAHAGLGLNRVEAYHLVRNEPSGRVLSRLGFRREGTLRSRVTKHGVFEDVHVCARLRDDPLETPGRG